MAASLHGILPELLAAKLVALLSGVLFPLVILELATLLRWHPATLPALPGWILSVFTTTAELSTLLGGVLP